MPLPIRLERLPGGGLLWVEGEAVDARRVDAHEKRVARRQPTDSGPTRSLWRLGQLDTLHVPWAVFLRVLPGFQPGRPIAARVSPVPCVHLGIA